MDKQINIKEIGLSIPKDRKIKSKINPKLIIMLLIKKRKKIFKENIMNKNRGIKKVIKEINVPDVKD